MDGHEQPSQSPYRQFSSLSSSSSSSSSSLLKDVSNFKTPNRPSRIPNFPSPSSSGRFFTAYKGTPPRSSSSFHSQHDHRRLHPRPSLSARSIPKATAAARRRLKAFELEQSQSSRKAQIKKEQSLKSLSKSLTTWLNFLFQNPRSCGCDVLTNGEQSLGPAGLGKREGGPRGSGVGVDAAWRCPKRQRDAAWCGGKDVESEEGGFWVSREHDSLKNSLKDVCSLDDLKQRMRIYLSLENCKEIFDVMTRVVKSIDEGRLKMRPHCPMVTDVGMKEKAVRILMCYSPVWLRIGLYVVFGGESLLLDGDVNSDQEIAFLKMVIEKQFFLHTGLAKAYAYNKMVDGLYKPGYYENLGNVILKRFLLLVLILDRAKSQSSLPLKYGIDGIDGGSPLLFIEHFIIKSSQQLINDFLSSDVMLGEGNLLAHLLIIGYKVSHQQCALVEYEFRVSDLFIDFQDGVRLCRAIQLLQKDSSILMKMVVPSDTHKKNLVNCGVALQYLKRAGVKLHDEDGMTIVEDDIADGDKELTVSLLWNMFIHLQIPLLINKVNLAEEIVKIRGTNEETLQGYIPGTSLLELLLKWIQAVSEKYNCKADGFPSLVDGKAIWCLLDYYFRKELCCSHSHKDPHANSGEESIMSAGDYADSFYNFILSQKLTTLLGNFPEVLQVSDILEHGGAISDQSVVILLVFLSSQLTVQKPLDQLNFHKLLGCDCQSPDRRHSKNGRHSAFSKFVLDHEGTDGHNIEDAARKFNSIKAWWQDMAARNNKLVTKPASSTPRSNLASQITVDIQRDKAAKVIQSQFRRSIECRKFLKIRQAVSFLQTVIRAWLMVKQKSVIFEHVILVLKLAHEQQNQSENFERYVKYVVERHRFVKLKRSALLIQRAARIWITRRHRNLRARSCCGSAQDRVCAAIAVQKCIRGWTVRRKYKVARMQEASSVCRVNGFRDLEIEAAARIQLSWRNFISSRSLHNQQLAVTKIQGQLRGWLLRRKFLCQKQAVKRIQSHFRVLRWWRAYKQLRIATRSATVIQSHVRGWIARTAAWRHRDLIVILQKCCRAWLTRKNFLLKREAAIRIQSAIRCSNCWTAFHCHKRAAIEIQQCVRRQITRTRILGAYPLRAATTSYYNSEGDSQSFELKMMLSSVLKLQRWWRYILVLKQRTKSAIIIQSHFRGYVGRQKAFREKQCVVLIQSYWKGYVARKESRGQLLDLRLRIQESAKNVDDSMRIINRLKMALSELQSIKSVTGILHICATLDIATQHSQICCEELVAAGAIGTLLKQIRAVSRSIPDQEVLKHALYTLRNLTRYPDLTELLIDSHGSVETLMWELLRNKEEGYFIALEILKRICSNHKGVVAVRKPLGLLKRLQSLVEELQRKAAIEKRTSRAMAAREITERRLRETVELLKLIN